MRRIHTFQYYGKSFTAGDLTVGDFWLYLQNQDIAIEKILTEFNEKPPRMSPDHFKKFMDIMFNSEDDDDARRKRMLDRMNNGKDPKKTKKLLDEIANTEKDFHVEIGRFCRFMNWEYEGVMNMPMWVYTRMWKDAKIISGEEPLVKDRHKKTIDSAGLKKALK